MNVTKATAADKKDLYFLSYALSNFNLYDPVIVASRAWRKPLEQML